MNKKTVCLILAIITLSASIANARLSHNQRPKEAKNICWGCQLTEKEKKELQKLVQNYNIALQKYCSWISIAQRQHYINRPPKETLYHTKQYKKQTDQSLERLKEFYISAGISTEEIAKLRQELNQGEKILTCDLAYLSTN